jgi:RNA polymerase subunit RPABC4/transcription elongation factor Spt4
MITSRNNLLTTKENKMKHDPIAYTYEADTHCPACAEKRFGVNGYGFIVGFDSEGNEVGVIAPWDEWYDLEYQANQTLVCATCERIIESFVPVSEPEKRHAPNSDCDGETFGIKCAECDSPLCTCEYAYGHDCE